MMVTIFSLMVKYLLNIFEKLLLQVLGATLLPEQHTNIPLMTFDGLLFAFL